MDSLRKSAASPLRARIPAPEELAQVIRVADAGLRQHSRQSVGSDYPLIYHPANRRNLRAVRVRGKVVSTIAYLPWRAEFAGCRFRLGMVSLVATLPRYRGKGYALACLESGLTQMARQRIPLALLWTLAPTFPFYERAGFRAVRPLMDEFPCTSDDAARLENRGYAIVKFRRPDRWHLAGIRSLYARNHGGLQRPRRFFSQLLSLPLMETFLAMRSGRIEAYLVVSRAENKPGIVEADGSVAGLESLLQQVLSQWPKGEPIHAYDYPARSALGRLLDRRLPGRRRSCREHMMIRLNAPRRFLRQIRPWLEHSNRGCRRACSIEIAELGEMISLEFGARGLRLGSRRLGEHAVVTLQQLTSILFGAHPERPASVPASLTWIRPVRLSIWMLNQS